MYYYNFIKKPKELKVFNTKQRKRHAYKLMFKKQLININILPYNVPKHEQ